MSNMYIYIACLVCLLAVSCQQKGKETGDSANMPEPVMEYSSAANEINMVLGVENGYYPEEEDTLHYNLFAQIDSLMSTYVYRKISSINPTRPYTDVTGYLSGVSETLFSDEDWLYLDDLEKYRESLVLLQQYAEAVSQGKTADYPYAETQHMLHEFMENLSMMNSESSEYPDACHLLYYRYLQQVLAWCPDIRKMAAMVTPDERAAILTVGDCIYQTYAKPMLLKDKDGYWMPVIRSDSKPNHVYSFTHGGRTFYLFSEHGDMERYSRFSLALFVYENNEWRNIHIKEYDQTVSNWYTKKILRTEGDVQYVEDWDAYITFNPKEKRWNFCYEKDGIYYPYPGSKTLYLDLDIENATAGLHLASEY